MFQGSQEDLIGLSRKLMGGEQPMAMPEDALARLWRYAVRQGWEV